MSHCTVKIEGGLGNQLFKIFGLLSYATRTNKKYVFEYKDNSPSVTHRPTYWNTFFKELNNSSSSGIKWDKIHKENGLKYEKIDDFIGNIKMIGYFMSEKYFSENYLNICNLLNIRSKQLNIKNKYQHLFKNNNQTISVHFRLGDYKYLHLYPVQKLKYYSDALDKIFKTIDINDSHILYFCEAEDDVYVKKNILDKLKYNVIFTKVPNAIPDYEQLLLMSCCNHNIIANSTFSWWGAYLNNNVEKVVITPSTWVTNKKMNNDIQDLPPNKWIKI